MTTSAYCYLKIFSCVCNKKWKDKEWFSVSTRVDQLGATAIYETIRWDFFFSEMRMSRGRFEQPELVNTCRRSRFSSAGTQKVPHSSNHWQSSDQGCSCSLHVCSVCLFLFLQFRKLTNIRRHVKHSFRGLPVDSRAKTLHLGIEIKQKKGGKRKANPLEMGLCAGFCVCAAMPHFVYKALSVCFATRTRAGTKRGGRSSQTSNTRAENMSHLPLQGDSSRCPLA